MARLKILPEDNWIEVPSEITLLEALRMSGYRLDAPCSGLGICGKCKVIAEGELSPLNEAEQKFIKAESNERLACMSQVIGDVKVGLLDNFSTFQSAEQDFGFIKTVNNEYKVIQAEDESNLYHLYWQSYEIDTYKNYPKVLGVAVDIGTTGISYALVDLESGEKIEKLSSLNQQVSFGGDVLSRMTATLTDGSALTQMHDCIINQLNQEISALASKADIDTESIYHIAIAANTTMVHFLLAAEVKSMSKYPYHPKILAPSSFPAQALGLKSCHSKAKLSIMPGISAYVGGDIVSGLLCEEVKRDGLSLFIDIGTNGEIVLIDKDHMYCASAAAGPALEGMNIECGCRANEGAIERFTLSDDGNPIYKTIGDKEATGICGSGLIDLVGSLVNKGWINTTGRWEKDKSNLLTDKKYYITESVYLSQKDIRQIQLAKGAIASGILALLHEVHKSIDDVETVYIAGAFGFHISQEHLLSIGLIPKGCQCEMVFLGNTSLKGAYRLLLDEKIHEDALMLSKKVKYIELSTIPNFQDTFIQQLNF